MTAKEIDVADKILIGCVLIRRALSALNPFRKLTSGDVHVIARESANIAFTAMEYRKLYLLEGSAWWDQAVKCGFVQVEKLTNMKTGKLRSVRIKKGGAK